MLVLGTQCIHDNASHAAGSLLLSTRQQSPVCKCVSVYVKLLGCVVKYLAVL